MMQKVAGPHPPVEVDVEAAAGDRVELQGGVRAVLGLALAEVGVAQKASVGVGDAARVQAPPLGAAGLRGGVEQQAEGVALDVPHAGHATHFTAKLA